MSADKHQVTNGSESNLPPKSKVLVFLMQPTHPVMELEGGDLAFAQPPCLSFDHENIFSSFAAPCRRSNKSGNSNPLPSNLAGDGDNKGTNRRSKNGSGTPPEVDDSVEPRPDPVDPNITLSSVGGLDEHVKYLKQAIMYPLKHQGSLSAWGVDPPKGIMFHGPPGSGKTLLAKALANELSKSLNKKFSFFYQKGGESFGKYFGESQKNLQALFAAARHYKPSIIFLDEIDGLCPERSKASGSSEAYATVVTALLGLIDSVKRGEVFIIGATNRLEAVDAAVRRPGRFDKQLAFSLPSEEGRRHIIGIHTKSWPHDHPTGNLLSDISTKTNGYSGADLEKACRDTVVAAMSRSGDIPPQEVHITRQDWEAALQNMKHTSTNIFGSTLLISEPIFSVLTPLVSNIVDEIIDLIKPLISGKLESNFSNLSRNSLLVWDVNQVSEHFTNGTIMRSVLSNPILGKIPTYLLNDETLLTRMNRNTLIGEFNTIIQQVLNSDKPCILYIPRIHILENLMKQQKVASTFYRQLKQIQGDNVILLATSTIGLADQSNEIGDLFIGCNRSYAIRSPNRDERKEFFNQIYEELINIKVVPPTKKAKTDKINQEEDIDYNEVFQDQLDRLVEETNRDTIEAMMTLCDALNLTKSEWKSKFIDLKTLADELDYMIEKYIADKEEL